MPIYRFYLKQHIGAPSIAAICEGERVMRGQRIAVKPPQALGAPVHSSVTGTVAAVCGEWIDVEADGRQDGGEYVRLTGGTPLELIGEAGIVGLGGAGFPTSAKLAKPLGKGGTVIVNAAECEPILCHNIRRIESNAAQIVRGLRIAMDVVQAELGIIAVKGKHDEAVQALRECIADSGIEIHLLPDLYPMGEERALIRETLGVLLNVDELPYEANAVVLNAETAYRIYEAVDQRKPLIDKDVTVAGKLRGEPVQVFEDVPIGTPVSSLIGRAGGCAAYGELIMGGPFTGKRTAPDAPVVKTTGGVLAAEVFPKGPQRLGILVCACGADEARMRQLAKDLGSDVVGVAYCKQAQQVKGAYKCENPGKCPGQVQKVLELKKAGAQAILVGNCSDCTNTVMSCAPQMKLPVYHCTDGALRAVNHRLIRRLRG